MVVLYQGEPTPIGDTVTLYYKTSWTTANIHYQIGTGSWTTAPGVAMSNADVSGYKTITIDLGTATKLTSCFNNGSGTWDSNNQSNYTFSPGIYTIANGVVTSGTNYYFGSAGTYSVKNGVITSSTP